MGLRKAGDHAVALRPIEQREYPRDTDGLLAQLSDADPSVRRWAARDLADHPRAAAGVCARVAVEADPGVRAALFNTAAALGGPVVAEAMVQLLRSEEPAVRNGAIEVLAGAPDEAAPHIDRLLRDADTDVRIFTVNLLGELRHPDVPCWLAQVLESEADTNVIGAALEVLLEVGGPETLPVLERARHRFAGEPYIGFSIDLAVERIGTA